MKKSIIGIIFIGFACTLIGCGTVKGVGEDLSALGRGIVNASEKVADGLKKESTE